MYIMRINLQSRTKQNKVDSKIYPVLNYPKCIKSCNSYKLLAIRYNTSNISVESHVYS